MSDHKTCFYCSNSYTTKDSEHVFPDGLGGENKMMSCICWDCNQKFSPLENELISKSFISFFRAAETPASIMAAMQHVMKETRTFRIDNDLTVALELHVSSGLRERLVAQIILKDNLLQIRFEDESDLRTSGAISLHRVLKPLISVMGIPVGYLLLNSEFVIPINRLVGIKNAYQ